MTWTDNLVNLLYVNTVNTSLSHENNTQPLMTAVLTHSSLKKHICKQIFFSFFLHTFVSFRKSISVPVENFIMLNFLAPSEGARTTYSCVGDCILEPELGFAA